MGPDGRWINDIKDVRPVPYRLPELTEAIAKGQIVLLAEGEKDCKSLGALCITATCNAGGAGNWRNVHAACLRDADVVVLPDNDEKGRKHGEAVASSLQGIAQRVRVLQLPRLSDKEDVSDWLARRSGTADELWKLVEQTPDWQATSDQHQREEDWKAGCLVDPRGGLLPNLANALAALRSHPNVSGCFGYDEMLRASVLLKPLPGSMSTHHSVRLVSDTDVCHIQEWLQRLGLGRIGKDTTHQGCRNTCS